MEGEQKSVNMVAGAGEGAGSSGPIIGAVVILAIIALGGFYFWSQRAEQEVMTEQMMTESTDNITVQSTSDEATAIEADLNATDIESLDSELNAS